MSNGGNLIIPSFIKDRQVKKPNKIISSETSEQIRNILRKVVTNKNGTASLADKVGYYVGGKTGTAESYGNKKTELILLSLFFPSINQITLYL